MRILVQNVFKKCPYPVDNEGMRLNNGYMGEVSITTSVDPQICKKLNDPETNAVVPRIHMVDGRHQLPVYTHRNLGGSEHDLSEMRKREQKRSQILRRLRRADRAAGSSSGGTG